MANSKKSRFCWGCNILLEGDLLECSLCKERHLPPSYFCSKDCQILHWPRHRAWHKQQKKSEQGVDGGSQDAWSSLSNLSSFLATETSSEKSVLFAKGADLMARGNFRKAVRAFRKALVLDQGDPAIYFNLGIALGRSNNDAESCQMYLKAMELEPVGSKVWGYSASSAFNKLILPECAGVTKPKWWNDNGLKLLSLQVLEASSGSSRHQKEEAFQVRADVLSGGYLPHIWQPGLRTSAEVREAARCNRRAAELANEQEDIQRYNDNAQLQTTKADRYDALEAAKFSSGTKVRLHGLVKRPELNGSLGETLTIETGSPRVPVTLLSPEKFAHTTVKLKPENVFRTL